MLTTSPRAGWYAPPVPWALANGGWKIPKRYAVGITALLPDHDRAGREHMEIVAQSLQGTANSIKIVALPNLSEKQDVSDWLSGGGTADALKDLAEQASKYSVKTRDKVPPGMMTPGNLFLGGATCALPTLPMMHSALRFTERYGNDLRYTSAQSRWNGWDECRWRLDETLKVFDLARREVRLASANSADGKTRSSRSECDDCSRRGAARPLRPASCGDRGPVGPRSGG